MLAFPESSDTRSRGRRVIAHRTLRPGRSPSLAAILPMVRVKSVGGRDGVVLERLLWAALLVADAEDQRPNPRAPYPMKTFTSSLAYP